MNGTDALAAFNLAAKWVKEGRYQDALSVKMLPSDRQIIEKRIAESGAGANTTKERT